MKRYFLTGIKNLLIRLSANKVTVVFDNERAPVDGIGAQIQRQWSVMLLARYMNWRFQGAPIVDLMFRSADFREERNRVDIIRLVNQIIESSQTLDHARIPRDVKALEIKIKIDDKRVILLLKKYPRLSLTICAILAGVFRLNLRLVLVDGFFLTNRNPDMYDLLDARAINRAMEYSGEVNRLDRDFLNIVLHIRRGEVNSRNFSHELSQRYTSTESFSEIVKDLLDLVLHDRKDYVITIFTDAPTKKSKASQEFVDMNLWESQLGIGNDFEIELESFDDLKKKHPRTVVRNDLDSITSLCMMIEADVLVMSKSSFSFVAGVLNRSGLVVYQDFWHQPLSRWLRWSSVKTLNVRM
jgi:hypothetical protein